MLGARTTRLLRAAQASQSALSAEALERIGALYAIESEIRGSPPDERARLRQARAGPLLDSLRESSHKL